MRSFSFQLDATREPVLTVRELVGEELTNLYIGDVKKLIVGLQDQLARMEAIDAAVSKRRVL